MILTSIFVCFCLASAFNYLRTRKQRAYIKNLKGPFTWPLLGAVHKLVLLTPKNFFQRGAAYLTKYGNFTRCWVFHRLFIPVADLELAKQLLNNEQYLNTGYELMRDWLGAGVLMCTPEQWPQRHQQISELFGKDNILELVELCRQQGVQLQLKFSEKADNRQVFDAWEVVAPAVMDLMVLTTCGVRPSEDYAQAFTNLTSLYRKRFLSAQSANRFTFWLSSPLMRRRQNRLIRQLNIDHLQFLSQNRRHQQISEQIKNKCFVVEQYEPMPHKFHQSLLDILMTTNSLTDKEICDELNTCNYLGYLLSSTTLCFALIMIARHPGVQQRCLEELQKSHTSTGWDLHSLHFLEAVLRETMRLYPPQVIVGRHLSKEFDYTHTVVGDGSLPSGSEIYINLYELQRNEDQYLAAHHFQPERFMDCPPELLSYSLGPRTCPAMQFSLLMLKSLLAPILMSFELLPYGNALLLDLRLVLGSRNGFQLALKPR